MSMPTPRTVVVFSLALLAGVLAVRKLITPAISDTAAGQWRVYGGDLRGDRYAKLDQITPANVATLIEAWRVDAGPGGLQASPLMVDKTLYVLTPNQAVLALDPGSGAQRWKFVPVDGGQQPVRGLAYWQSEEGRALFTSHGTFLTALDPATGRPVASFGNNAGSIFAKVWGASPDRYPRS